MMNFFNNRIMFFLSVFSVGFLQPSLLFSQKKLQQESLIDSICKRIDSDVNLKTYEVNYEKLLLSELCVCDKMIYVCKNDSISKVTTFSAHTSIASFEYFYYEGELILVEYKKQYEYKVKEQVRYYFEKDNLIKAVHVKGRRGGSENISIVARKILSDSKKYIDFLNHL